jgi:hypothetical protein
MTVAFNLDLAIIFLLVLFLLDKLKRNRTDKTEVSTPHDLFRAPKWQVGFSARASFSVLCPSVGKILLAKTTALENPAISFSVFSLDVCVLIANWRSDKAAGKGWPSS